MHLWVGTNAPVAGSDHQGPLDLLGLDLGGQVKEGHGLPGSAKLRRVSRQQTVGKQRQAAA